MLFRLISVKRLSTLESPRIVVVSVFELDFSPSTYLITLCGLPHIVNIQDGWNFTTFRACDVTWRVLLMDLKPHSGRISLLCHFNFSFHLSQIASFFLGTFECHIYRVIARIDHLPEQIAKLTLGLHIDILSECSLGSFRKFVHFRSTLMSLRFDIKTDSVVFPTSRPFLISKR